MSQVTAIIGHGRSPERRAWGPVIDQCAVVVRMWDWTWQDPADYGTEYDFGFVEIEDSILKSFYAHNKREPKVGWVGSLLRYTTMRLPENIEVVCQERWTFEAKRMGGVGQTGKLEFTRGTIAACWAICRSAPGDAVILVGFDNVLARKQLPMDLAFSPEYRANAGSLSFNGYKDNVTKFGNHDFAVEYPVMEKIAARYGVKLAFAQHVWPC